MAHSAHDTRSPVDSSMSISRGSGFGETSLAAAISWSVSLPRALSTATTRVPSSRLATMRLAARLRRSASATDVPPNFMTTVSGMGTVEDKWLPRAAADAVVGDRHRGDVGDVRADARRHDVRRPTPRRRRVSQQREQRQGRGHQRGAEHRAGPRLGQPAMQCAVPDPERRAVAPAQQQSQVALVARGHVRQVHDARHDLPGDERVVVVQRGAPLAPTALGGIGERHRRGAGGAGAYAANRASHPHRAQARIARSSSPDIRRPWMTQTKRKKIATDHHGLSPPIDSSAPIAPKLPPMTPMTRPNVLPATSEKPPMSWIAPRTIRTHPRVLRLVRMNLVSFTK